MLFRGYSVDFIYDIDDNAQVDAFVKFIKNDVVDVHYSNESARGITLYDREGTEYFIHSTSPWVEVFCNNVWRANLAWGPMNGFDAFITRLIITARNEGFEVGARFMHRSAE